MINFLIAKKILYKNQFGFRHKSSTTDSLICLTETIRAAVESGKLACGIFIELLKAFDTVDHKILLDKLQYCGFRGICNSWLLSYLTGREQFVQVGGKNSSTREVKHGVPKGSVLGPLLFLKIILFKHKLKTIKFQFKIKLDGKRSIFKDYFNYLGVLID